MKSHVFSLLAVGGLVLVGCDKSELHFQAPGVSINSSGGHFSASGDLDKLQEATGPLTSENRQISDFHGLQVESGIQVEFTQSDKISLELSAKKDVLPQVVTEVKSGTLRIGLAESFTGTLGPIKVKLSGPDLDSLEASGASKVNCTGSFHNPLTLTGSGGSTVDLVGSVTELSLELSGASGLNALKLDSCPVSGAISGGSVAKLDGKLQDVKLEVTGASTLHAGGIDGKTCQITLSGGSTAEADGKTDQLTVEATGASSAHLPSLVAQECQATAEGGSQIHVNATKSLKAEATGASTVGYTGKPFTITPDSQGGSNIGEDN